MRLILKIAEISQKIRSDRIDLYSAHSSFFMIMSFFPFIMFLFSVMRYTPIQESVILTFIHDIIPSMMQPVAISITKEIYSSSSFALLSVTAVSALWSSGKGFVSIIKGLNTVYNTGGETRNYFILRLHAIIYTLIFVVIIILMLLAMVFGNRVLNFFSANWPFIGLIMAFFLNLRVVIFMLILIAFFTIVYRFIPNRKSKLRRELPGAIFSGAGWVGFSALFSIYVDHSSGFSSTYGSLATLVIIMLWLYVCMTILFLGAELNTLLYKRWDRQR